jgi:hypothetical protein
LTLGRRRPCRKHQEEIVHPVIMRKLAADHIAELHAKADDERLTRRARRARRALRRAPSMRLGLSPRETLSYDDLRLDAGRLDAGRLDAGRLDAGRLDAGQRPATHEQPTAPPAPVMAGRTRGSVS